MDKKEREMFEAISLKIVLKQKMDSGEITDEQLKWFLDLPKEKRDKLTSPKIKSKTT